MSRNEQEAFIKENIGSDGEVAENIVPNFKTFSTKTYEIDMKNYCDAVFYTTNRLKIYPSVNIRTTMIKQQKKFPFHFVSYKDILKEIKILNNAITCL